MKRYELRYHPEVAGDVARLPANLRRRLAAAVEARLTTEPHRYAHPLRSSLCGCWRLRVGDYRVLFRIERDEVWVLAILHRRWVYDDAGARLDWTP